MRLIDADELKKYSYRTDWNVPVVDVSDIDNTPSVELDESVIQEVLNKRCMTVVTNEHLVALHGKRPKGEWIDYDNTFYKCPYCGYLLEKCCPQCQNKVILPKGGAE